jgi:hypothetical protein
MPFSIREDRLDAVRASVRATECNLACDVALSGLIDRVAIRVRCIGVPDRSAQPASACLRASMWPTRATS